MKILLVDDEAVALKALKKRVDWVRYGFTEVFDALNIDQAKEILDGERIDLILCDIEMPGENGLDLVAYVRDNYPWTRRVMLTCHAEFSYIQQAMRYGAKDYILKPVDYEELGELLEQVRQDLEEERQQARIDSLVQKARDAKEESRDFGTPALDSNEKRVDFIKEYIGEHLRDKITMKYLAEQMHMNEQYLTRIFKRETGQSVLDYITDQRMITAGRLLRETDYSVNFIADCVGCENYSYFTKLFKKQTGYTPTEYRGQFKKD